VRTLLIDEIVALTFGAVGEVSADDLSEEKRVDDQERSYYHLEQREKFADSQRASVN